MGNGQWIYAPGSIQPSKSEVSLIIAAAAKMDAQQPTSRAAFTIPRSKPLSRTDFVTSENSPPNTSADRTSQPEAAIAKVTTISGAGLFPRPAGGFKNVDINALGSLRTDEDGNPIRSVALLHDAGLILPIEGNMIPRKPEKRLFGNLTKQRAKIAIVIDDLGQDGDALGQILELDPALTLSFLPYGQDLQAQVNGARRRGHEIMLHMPMEPYGNENPGPLALNASLDFRELDQMMGQNFDRFSGYVGMNNHMGSRFTADYSLMRQVMARMREKGIFFLDSRTGQYTTGRRAARDAGVANIARDVFLDNTRTKRAIWRALYALETIADDRGWAVAIGHPYSETIGALRVWLADAAERGFDLVPISDLVYRNR